MKTFAALALILAPTVAMAAPPSDSTTEHHYYVVTSGTRTVNLLDGVALNATAATRTITLLTADGVQADNAPGYTKLRVQVDYTWTAASTVTLTPTCSQDGTNYAAPTTRSCSSGTCTLYPQVDSRPVTASENFTVEYDIRGCRSFKVLFGGASAGASDLVTVMATAIVGQ